MFSNDLLNKYLDAIDIEKAKVIRKLLPLYRLGLKTKEDILSEMQVHTGNRKTVYRYIIDRSTLTLEQIMCILSLYNITDIPGVDVVEWDEHIVVFVPEPQILITISEIMNKLTFVPDVIVSNELDQTFDLVMVPEVIVDIDIDSITINKPVLFVPEPIIMLDVQTGEKYEITFVPEPQIILSIPTADKTTLTFVPEPTILFGESGLFDIVLVPGVQIELESEVAPDDRVFYGVSQSELRPLTANFSALLSMVRSPIPGDLEIDFPRVAGYYIFALPAAADLRRSWYVDEDNRGAIGGSWDDVFSNAWPDPILQTHGGVSYKVYIGSYGTNFTKPVRVRSFI